MLLNKKLFYLL